MSIKSGGNWLKVLNDPTLFRRLYFSNQNKRPIEKIDVHERDSNYITALHASVLLKHLWLMSYIIDEHADIEYQDLNGYTPLHYSIANVNFFDGTCLLLNRRANINARTNNGHTCLHLAAINKRGPEMINYLLYRGANPDIINYFSFRYTDYLSTWSRND